jgi:hypothetical protein
LWGTPLAMIHGAAVLSGLADRSPAANGAAIAAILPGLDRLRRDGRRIRCLTSTESGIAVFPFDPSWVKLDWEGEAWSPQVLVQHSKARQFQLRTRETRFRLYTIEIPGGAGGLSEPAVSSDR